MAHFVRFSNIGYGEYISGGQVHVFPLKNQRKVYVNVDAVAAVYEIDGGAAICFGNNADNDEELLYIAAPVESVMRIMGY